MPITTVGYQRLIDQRNLPALERPIQEQRLRRRVEESEVHRIVAARGNVGQLRLEL